MEGLLFRCSEYKLICITNCLSEDEVLTTEADFYAKEQRLVYVINRLYLCVE